MDYSPEILIPIDLLEDVADRECLLFAGAGVSVSVHGQAGLPSAISMARDLCTRLGQTASEADAVPSLRQIAQDYKDQRGEVALRRYFMDVFDRSDVKPLRAHLAIARLPLEVIVTTNYDRLIELALAAERKRYQVVIRPSDIPFIKSENVVVMKLHGCVTDPETMVITEDDYWNFRGDIDARVDLLKSQFLTKTILFVGYGLADENFQQIYKDVYFKLKGLMRRAYAVQLNPPPRQIEYWKRRELQIIPADATQFLEALYQQVGSGVSQRHRSQQKPASRTDSWDSLLEACRAQVEEEIGSTVGKKYIPHLYVSRAVERDVVKFISGRRDLRDGICSEVSTLGAIVSAQSRSVLASQLERLQCLVNELPNEEEANRGLTQIERHFAEKKTSALGELEALRLSVGMEDTNLDALLTRLENLVTVADLGSESLREASQILGHLGIVFRNERDNSSETQTCLARLAVIFSFESAFEKIAKIRSLYQRLWQHCFIIIDRAGSGKTNLLCDLALNYSRQQPTVFISGKRLLQDEFGIEKAIASSLAYSQDWDIGSFQRLFDQIEETVTVRDTDFLVFIDGINENRDVTLMNQALLHLLQRYKGRRIRVCFTCRDVYWDFFSSELFLPHTWNLARGRLYSFSKVEFNRAWRVYFLHYKIEGELIDEAKEHCRHPLLLRFFCEAYGNPEAREPLFRGQISEIRLKTLFDDYWQSKVQAIAAKAGFRVTDPVVKLIMQIARHLRLSHRLSVDASELSRITGLAELENNNSIYTLILDEDVILEERTTRSLRRQVYFTYDEFMEYAMARGLAEELEGADSEAIRTAIDGLTAEASQFRILTGVIEFLSLMLRKEWGALVWEQLAKKTAQWQKIAVRAFAQLSDDELDDELFSVLHLLSREGADEVRLSLTNNLRRISHRHSNTVIDLLRTLTTDRLMEIRIAAIKVARGIPHQERIRLLAGRLTDPNVIVRLHVVESLIELLPPEVPEPLSPALRDPDFRVRAVATEGLWRFGGPKVVQWLVSRLSDEHPAVRSTAIQTLADVHALSSIPALIRALEDTNSTVRENSALALGQLRAVEAENALIKRLNDRSRHVREAGTWALGQMTSDTAKQQVLQQLLYGRDPYIRAAAVEALGRIVGSTAIEQAIIRAVSDTHPYVRWQAAAVLGQVHTDASARALKRALGDADINVRSQAITALSQHPLSATEALLLEAIRAPQPAVRVAALRALTKAGSAAVEGVLTSALEDNSMPVQVAAIELLHELQSRSALPNVAKLLLHPDRRIRKQAGDYLAVLGDRHLTSQYLEPILREQLSQELWDEVYEVTSRIEERSRQLEIRAD